MVSSDDEGLREIIEAFQDGLRRMNQVLDDMMEKIYLLKIAEVAEKEEPEVMPCRET